MAAHSPPDHSRERRFFLDPEAPWETPRLADQELHHALHVNRVGPGDHLWGLDGAGTARKLEVTVATRRELTLRPLEEVLVEPRPGAPGSELIHVQVGLSLPKPGKAEEMVDRLTQIGVASLQPIVFQHSPDHARKFSGSRMEKLERASREAMKQCLRLWPMEIEHPVPLPVWLAQTGPTILLDPRADWPLPERLLEVWSGGPLRLLIGPEGGFHAAEWAQAQTQGVTAAALRGHVLRIETAAELAAGLALQLLPPR